MGREVVGSVRKHCGHSNVEVRGDKGMRVYSRFLKFRGGRSKRLNDAFKGMNMKFIRDLGGRLR